MTDWIDGILFTTNPESRTRCSKDPIERLFDEHRVISDASSTLETWALWLEQGGRVHRESLMGLLRFFCEFVDEVHHKKEETILIPTLLKAGLLGLSAQAADLSAEHHQERYLVSELRRLVKSEERNAPSCHSHFATLARELVAFQKQHLDTETREVYAYIDRLAPARRATLRRRLNAFDRKAPAAIDTWQAILGWLETGIAFDRTGPSPQLAWPV